VNFALFVRNLRLRSYPSSLNVTPAFQLLVVPAAVGRYIVKQKLLAELSMIVSFGVGTHNHPFKTLKASVTTGVNVPPPSVPVEIPRADAAAAMVAAPEIFDAGSLDFVVCGLVEVIVL
jgi:hypothetical protein